MYSFEQAALKVPAAKSNRARLIDTLLVNPLAELPPGSFGAKKAPTDPLVANLAFRNLARAKMVKLATGQGMAQHLASRGVAVTPLTKAQIRWSIVRDTAFKPKFGPDGQTFDMRDLLLLAFEGKKALLAPLGDRDRGVAGPRPRVRAL